MCKICDNYNNGTLTGEQAILESEASVYENGLSGAPRADLTPEEYRHHLESVGDIVKKEVAKNGQVKSIS